MKFSGNGLFELCFERNWDLPLTFFARKTGGKVYWLLDAIRWCTCAKMTHQQHVCGPALCNKLKEIIKTEQKQVFIKMAQCMNALAVF